MIFRFSDGGEFERTTERDRERERQREKDTLSRTAIDQRECNMHWSYLTQTCIVVAYQCSLSRHIVIIGRGDT